MRSIDVLAEVARPDWPAAEIGETYAIGPVITKRYPAATYLVQSTLTPVALGKELGAWIDGAALRAFMEDHGLEARPHTPQEVYLFNWVERAQGPVVFEVGYEVEPDLEADEADARGEPEPRERQHQAERDLESGEQLRLEQSPLRSGRVFCSWMSIRSLSHTNKSFRKRLTARWHGSRTI